MKSWQIALAWIGGVVVFLLAVVSIFWILIEIKHDKSAVQYVQDEWGWFSDKDDTKTDEVVVDSDDGSTQAIATINF